ncbi:MAG: phage holin family protein [Burkholderiales bacterium]|nr:phage holin family protein [Burkholderiales bacterium]
MFEKLLNDKLDSVRGWLSESVAFLDDRLTLARIEWIAEKRRLRTMVLAAVCALFCGFFALLCGAMSIVVAFWDSPYRLVAALGVTAFFAVLAVVAFVKVTRAAADGERAFYLSRREFQRDISAIREPS